MSYEKNEEFLQRIFPGSGNSFEAAYQDAWEKAKRANKIDRPLRVAETWVWGKNPIDWYRVVLEAPA